MIADGNVGASGPEGRKLSMIQKSRNCNTKLKNKH
jgi:hypothetical protein